MSWAYDRLVNTVLAAQAARVAVDGDHEDYDGLRHAEIEARARMCRHAEHKRAQAQWRARVEENKRRRAAMAASGEEGGAA
jgi:hypothetical protein